MPLKKQADEKKIKTITLNDEPMLRGAGHAFVGDWQVLKQILRNAIFIPTHCPDFVLDGFAELGRLARFNMINPLPHNNMMYFLGRDTYEVVEKNPATWMIFDKNGQTTQVLQCPTAGHGSIRATYSRRRTLQKFKIIEHNLEKEYGS